MRNRIDPAAAAPRFWPPKPHPFWQRALAPLHRWTLHRHHGIEQVELRGAEKLAAIPRGDGVLVCPNHSYTGDGSVMMEIGLRNGRGPFRIMAAYHVFQGHRGLDGWLLQRMGAFSVDREGCDRQAIRTAVELLSGGKSLVIFPEGEIYHLNERLTPLREGVAFMAVTAQRDLDKSGQARRVWMIPAAIRYRFSGNVLPTLESAMARLESRLLIKPPIDAPLHERIIRYGEILLTIKEKEQTGRSFDDDGQTLPMRLARLTSAMLAKLESRYLGKENGADTVPVRVKLLRQHLLDQLCADGMADARARELGAALEDVHIVLQLYSYPGDYLTASPTPERMAETIEKFEEDVYGEFAAPKGQRRATVTFGDPIDVKAQLGTGRSRGAASELTRRLEESLSALMTPEPS